MEFQPITPPPMLFPKGPAGSGPRLTRKKMLIFVGVIVFILFVVATLLSLSGGTGLRVEDRVEGIKQVFKQFPLLKQIVKTDSDTFLSTSLPRPIGDLALTDVPSYFDVTNVVKEGERMWFAGNGFILEYDTVKKAVTASTEIKRSGSCVDVVMAGTFLYAACDVRGLEDFEDTFKGFENSIHNYVIYKVDRKTRSVVQTFTPKDGFKSTVSYRLFADGGDVWVTAVGGVGHITADGKVDFFDTELAIAGKTVSAGKILVDGNHVWVVSVPTTESKGGISVYDKQTKGWLGFDPDDLQERERDKIDIEGLKTIPDGVQIAFRDGRISGTIRLVEKQYSYSTGVWTKINDLPTTGDGGIATYDYVAKTYPQPSIFTQVDARGFSQLRLPSTGQTHLTNGRRSYILSPEINKKRYLLTSASIDVIEDNSAFNRILVPLGEGIELAQSFPSPLQYQRLVRFEIEPVSMLSLVIDTACDPRLGCLGLQKAWLVNLKEGKLLRAYTAVDGLPSGKLLSGLTLRSDGKTLTVYNKLGIKLFTIDISSTLLIPSVLSSPVPAN